MVAPPADAVLWQEQVELPELPEPGPLPGRVDSVVVGAGYAGLAAARTLARAGRDVVVLEKGPLGWGDGGITIPELKAGPVALQKRFGGSLAGSCPSGASSLPPSRCRPTWPPQ